MKKNFFLTLMLAVLCTATSWAQFSPQPGKMYAFREVTSGLFLDIQTLGINEPLANGTTNNISLNATPRIIYFEEGETAGKYVMKNVEGTYAQQKTDGRDWNAVIGWTRYLWTITDADGDGYYTIARADGNFIGIDNPTNRAPLYCNIGTGLEFALVEFADLVDTHTSVKLKHSEKDLYMNTTEPHSIKFQTEATPLHILTSGSSYFIAKVNDTNFLAQVPTKEWDDWSASAASKEPYLWLFANKVDNNEAFSIAKLINWTDNKHLGSDEENLIEGTGIWANVGSGCNKWIFTDKTNKYSGTVPDFTGTTDDINNINSNGQYLTKLAINGLGVYSNSVAPSDMYVETQVTGIKLEPGVEYTMNLTFPMNQKTQKLVANIWIDANGDGIFETHLGTTGDKAANKNDTNDISTVRFTVPASAKMGLTRIRLRLDSSWNIAESATADANRLVYDIPVTIAPAQPYTFIIDNPSELEVIVEYNGEQILGGAQLPANADPELFTVPEIPGHTWEIVFDHYNKTITLLYVKKYSLHLPNAPLGVTVKYNGVAITEGYFFENGFDSQYLTVEGCPDGYSWQISKDTAGKFIIITFTKQEAVENPAAVVALIKRIGGEAAADKFKFVLDPSLKNENNDETNENNDEIFVIDGDHHKVRIQGNTISAITTGLGWYLQNHAHINIAWNSLNEKSAGEAYADLSNIPVPATAETHTTDAKYRYYLNYCTFGYSMTTWTWKRWQQEIDWMALHGINMPLQIVGLEEVWRKFLTLEEKGQRKYNYTDAEAMAFVPGPAFTAWWGMNNLEGWGGTAANGWGGVQDKAWYARQQQLATQILDRQRELGMQPVLPGFSGMVPSDFQTKTGVVCDAGGWCGFTRPKIVLPSNERFAEIAADYYKCLAEVMGESQYYSIDPFHEGGSINGGEEQDYKDAYKAIYDAMEAAKPASQWVIQQWQWNDNNPNFQAYSLNAVPAGRLIVLDLFSDGRPEFGDYNGYTPQEAVFCAIPNFGGRSGLMGRLNKVAENYFTYKRQYSSIKGIGAAPEAIEQTPVTYDLIFQLPWMGSEPDVAEWVANYSIARYGVENAEVQAAWELLRQGVLNYGADAIQGPVEDVWAARPNLEAKAASSWGSTLSKPHGSKPRPDLTYTKKRQQMLIEATYKLLAQSSAVSGNLYESNYNYDIVEFGGAVMADYAHYLLLGIKAAKEDAGDAFATDAKYIARRDAFLALIADVDEFKGTNLNFRLGKWTQEARDAAAEAVALGATAANADWYEYNNARTLITTWGDYAQNNSGGLRDYSYRSWQGLLKDYYLPRWKYYFENNCTHPDEDVRNYFYFEWNWAHGLEHNVGNTSKSSTKLAQGKPGYSYSRDAEGVTVDVAQAKLAKYIIPVQAEDGTVYAYRHLENDLKESVRLTVEEGGTVNLCDYFDGLLANETINATITSDCIARVVEDADATIVIKNDAANGEATEYDAKITLTDGTVIDFVLVVHSEAFATAKEGLAAIIAQMETLTAQVATYNPTGTATKIALTATSGQPYYIWSNAPQSDDEGNIHNLLDGQPGTFFHSNWQSTIAPADGLDHHLTVELGEGNSIENFKFYYQARTGNYLGDYPKTIKVQGSNNGADYVDIATVNPRNANDHTIENGATWTSSVFDGNEYTYLRFMVTATTTNKNKDGHIFFHMAEFALYEVSASAVVYSHLVGKINNEEAAAFYDALLAAKRVYDNSMTQSEIDAEKTLLQEKYVALNELLGGNILPVKLTVDEANPVLYKIIIKRAEDGSKVLGYDEPTGMVAVQDKVDNSSWQAWYFMSSTNGVTIHPYNADGKVLSADNTSDGEAKVWAVEKGLKTFYEWKFVTRSNGYFNIQAHNGSNYFSNKGGVSNKMGFWLKEPDIDGGSLFKFVATFENANARYYQLHDFVDIIPDENDAKLKQMASGTAPGYYNTENADRLREAYTTAKTLDNAGSANSTAADCYATYKALREAYATYDEMQMIMPTHGAVYRIRNYVIDDEVSKKNHYIAVNNEVKIELPASVSENNQGAMWVCIKDEDKYKFVSALGTAAFGWNVNMTETIDVLRENSIAYRIDAGGEPGSLRIAAFHTDDASWYSLALTSEEWNSRDKPLFNRGKNGRGQYDKWSTDWYLEPVENVDIAFNRDLVAGHKWGTLYLPYAVEVPEGITAYYATNVNAGEKVIELAEVGDVIPAYTPVLINRSEDDATETFPFYYTTQAGTAVDGNLFAGRIMESVVECENNKKYYLLLNAGKGEAFYWVAKEYNENGVFDGSNGTHIKCEANKAYLALDGTNPAALSFRYGGDTTEVDEIESENGKVKTIYDLQGRKLTEITRPGFYIIDGKKVLVK